MSSSSSIREVASWRLRSSSPVLCGVAVMALFLSVATPSSVMAQESSTNRRLIEKIDPAYPALAKRNGIVGAVKLRVLIAPDGRAKTVEILGGNPVLAETARDSVRKWKWASGERDTNEVVEVKFDSAN